MEAPSHYLAAGGKKPKALLPDDKSLSQSTHSLLQDAPGLAALTSYGRTPCGGRQAQHMAASSKHSAATLLSDALSSAHFPSQQLPEVAGLDAGL